MGQRVIERQASAAMVTPGGSDEAAFARWAGWSGLLATLAFLLTIVVNSLGGPAAPEAPGEILSYLTDVADTAWASYTYGIAGMLLAVLYVPMAVGIHRLLNRSTAAWFGSTAVVIGLAVLFPAYVLSVLVPAGLSPVATDVGGAGVDALYAVNAFSTAAAEVFFAAGSVLSLAFGPLLWGYEWLQTDGLKRWLGWTAVATGVTGLVWLAWGAGSLGDSAAVLVVLIVNVVLSLVFFAGASLALVSRGRR